MKQKILNFLSWAACAILSFMIGYVAGFAIDHYTVDGQIYRMSEWSCRTSEFSSPDVGIWVSCERKSGIESFEKLAQTFSIVDSKFDK